MKKYRLWKDERGVSELPMQYMVAIIVASIAIAIIGFAGYHLWKDMQVKETVKEVDKIVKEAELMYNTADEGTIQTITINFPSGMKKAVFGSIDSNKSNRYYVIMDWGENNSFYSKNANFGFVVLYRGINCVTLELINDDRGKYVKIEPS